MKNESLTFGTMPAYNGVEPTKAADAQYTYTFNNMWSPAIVAVEGDAVYEALFDATVRSYVVTFMNGNDTLQTGEWAYGQTPVYSGATPIRVAVDSTYVFDKWSPSIGSVTGEATYEASFIATAIKYTVIFRNEDGTELQKTEYEYNAIPDYTGVTPTKAADAQYTYTFDKWDKTIEGVTGDVVYTATYSRITNSYTIVFLNADSTELKSSAWEYGKTPVYNGADPTKAADDQYTYTFSGWTPEIVPVTGAATYIATFSTTPVKYTVIFKNADGTDLQSGEWEYGAMPEYTGVTPTKESTADKVYTFSGWNPAIEAVTGAATYIAQFSETARIYTVTWSMNGEELKEQVAFGVVPTAPVVKDYQTASKVYTFDSWDKAIVAVIGDVTYTATYKSKVRMYTVTFVVGPIRYAVEVPYDTPMSEIVNGALADALSFYGFTKDADGNFCYSNGNTLYTFLGWDADFPDTVTEDATYTAIYITEPILGIDDIEAEKVQATKIIEEGVLYIIRDGKKFSNTGRLVE